MRNWQRDAVRLAMPTWEWRDDDVAYMDVEANPDTFRITVRVHRAGDPCENESMTYGNEWAMDFWAKLAKAHAEG